MAEFTTMSTSIEHKETKRNHSIQWLPEMISHHTCQGLIYLHKMIEHAIICKYPKTIYIDYATHACPKNEHIDLHKVNTPIFI